ncbi:MAG: YjbQ family protein [Caldilineaceae bacterium]|nr:YjbQ family protein [Caldilineaceae bacterium]
MVWTQREIRLTPRARGFHLITNEVLADLPEVRGLAVGLMHLFIQHTSASLAISENADPEVRVDMETFFDRLAPENAPYYTHTYEGPDDMPAHLKAVLLGSSLTIPVTNGQMNLGVWQGIYLCEHRTHGSARRLIVTLSGQLLKQ